MSEPTQDAIETVASALYANTTRKSWWRLQDEYKAVWRDHAHAAIVAYEKVRKP